MKDDEGNVIGGVAQVHFREQSVQTARRLLNVYNELEFLREQYKRYKDADFSFEDIIGNSEIMRDKKREALQAAKTNFAVLITGESGTGKDIFAKAIHNLSSRSERPFVSVNCAAIPGELLESELFGYEEGAFTGAKRGGRQGKFIQADGGTIFLDEIGDMPLAMQAKILRVLQEGEVDKIGGSKPIPVDVRVISATRKNLEQMIREEKFREDLYYRLNIINLQLPPLRSRKEDIPPLVQQFMTQLNGEYNRKVQLSKEVLDIFCNYNWRGNIRELENVIKGAYAICDGLEILPSDLPAKIKSVDKGSERRNENSLDNITVDNSSISNEDPLESVHLEGSLKKYLNNIEKEIILAAYEQFNSVRKAAEYLGMSMSTYVRKRQIYREE